MRQQPQSGMTLIELIVAMALTLVAAAASYTLFVGQSRLMKQTQSTVEMQDNARIAMEMLTRDIRNAGFMVPVPIAVQIEDNCGNTSNDLKFDTTTDTYSVAGAGTAVMTDGDLLGTTQNERCPNGSDRLILISRPRIDFAQGAGGPGSSLQLDVNCPGNDCVKVFTNGGITSPSWTTGSGTGCDNSGMSDPVTLCAVGDPFACQEVTIEPHSGQCNDCTAPQCTLKVYAYPSGSPFQSSAEWADVGGKFGAGFQAWQYRIYQLMDVDSDGSTELVFSDDAHAMIRAGAAGVQAATWNVIANNIDDLQVAYSRGATPMTFASGSIYIYPGCNEAAVGYDCGTEVDSTAGDDPIGAVRVSIIARSPTKQRTPQGGVANYTREALENNAPAAANANNVEATAVVGASPGCGTPINFASCTGNGNAPGFNRRVLTQAITTRNTQQ